MAQTAQRMHEAGLTDSRRDKPAGDEGTNPLIDVYVRALESMGVENAFACITGKSDMPARAPATGVFAAVIQREGMRATGVKARRVGLSGLGMAGGFYAAEACDPQFAEDQPWELSLPAVGELVDGRPQTLMTSDPGGLPITRDMIESMLLHPGKDTELQHEKVKGNRLLALARKLNAAGCEDLRLVDQDVLTIDPELADTLVPASTSHAIHGKNVAKIGMREINSIANVLFAVEVPAEARARFNLTPSTLFSIGGVAMSYHERARDLARIEAEKAGETFEDKSVDFYNEVVRQEVIQALRNVQAMEAAFGLDRISAIRAVSLGNYALARGMQIDQTPTDLLLRAA